ncbi:hypothetical protein BX070DRAFT_150124 [Coemansia spiralis]|nr:hypothetical protein BX070DRAFT_150124 [Coemansia spiralis]
MPHVLLSFFLHASCAEQRISYCVPIWPGEIAAIANPRFWLSVVSPIVLPLSKWQMQCYPHPINAPLLLEKYAFSSCCCHCLRSITLAHSHHARDANMCFA